MRTTASFELFPDAPSERVMARARYLAREGRLVDAERAYRDVLAQHPDLKGGWAECFELLRSQGRRDDALRLAEGARALGEPERILAAALTAQQLEALGPAALQVGMLGKHLPIRSLGIDQPSFAHQVAGPRHDALARCVRKQLE